MRATWEKYYCRWEVGAVEFIMDDETRSIYLIGSISVNLGRWFQAGPGSWDLYNNSTQEKLGKKSMKDFLRKGKIWRSVPEIRIGLCLIGRWSGKGSRWSICSPMMRVKAELWIRITVWLSTRMVLHWRFLQIRMRKHSLGSSVPNASIHLMGGKTFEPNVVATGTLPRHLV